MRNYDLDTRLTNLAVNNRKDMIGASVPLEESARCGHRGAFLMTDSKNASGQLPKRVNTNREGSTSNHRARSSGAWTTGPQKYGVSELSHTSRATQAARGDYWARLDTTSCYLLR